MLLPARREHSGQIGTVLAPGFGLHDTFPKVQALPLHRLVEPPPERVFRVFQQHGAAADDPHLQPAPAGRHHHPGVLAPEVPSQNVAELRDQAPLPRPADRHIGHWLASAHPSAEIVEECTQVRGADLIGIVEPGQGGAV